MAAAADRAKAEARAVLQPDGTTVVPLQGEKIKVLPVHDWRQSAVKALRENHYDLWAQKCLTPESYLAWDEIDPTLGQCEEFFALWQQRTGQDLGESEAS